MKFVSFNVNGIRAILNKGFKEIFECFDADILSLNETKWSDDNDFIFKPNGYYIYFTNSKVKKGYSGVAVFSKIEPLNVHYGLDNNEYDEEGRIISLEFKDFFYVACYVPNSGEELKRLRFRIDFEEKMKNYLVNLDKIKPVIYTGDLNVAHEEIDIKNPKANTHNAGFTKEERKAFTNLLSNNFIDTFRYLYPNVVKYSWWSYRFNARANNAGWRIDYFVISDRLKTQLVDAKIDNDIYGSDHCPIELILNL